MAKRQFKARIYQVPLSNDRFTYAIKKPNGYYLFYDYFDKTLDIDHLINAKLLFTANMNIPSVNKSNWIKTDHKLEGFLEPNNLFTRKLGYRGVYEHYVRIPESPHEQHRRFVADLTKGYGWIYYGFDDNKNYFEEWHPDRSFMNGSIVASVFWVHNIVAILDFQLDNPGIIHPRIYCNEYQESKGPLNDPDDWVSDFPQIPYGYIPRKKGDPYFELVFHPLKESELSYFKNLGNEYYINALKCRFERENGFYM